MIRRGFCIVFLTLSSASATGAPESVSEREFQTYQELAQTKLDAAHASISKDQQILLVRLDSQDKRVADQQSRISDIGSYLTVYGVLITLAAATLGLIGYFSVRSRAREEARTESKKWFDEHAKSLHHQVSDFEEQIASLRNKVDLQADQHCADIQTRTNEIKHLALKAKQILQEEMSHPSTEPMPGIAPTSAIAMFERAMSRKRHLSVVLNSETQALVELAEQLRDKPESEYNFEDWDNRAFAAHQANQLEDAVYFWQHASEMPDAEPSDVARALFNKGGTLSQLERSEEAITVYDDLLARFGDAADPALRQQVANTLFNKGGRLNKLERSEEAITVYDNLLASFGDATEPALREHVAKALFNKGGTLGQLERSEEAIAVYDNLLTRFGDAAEPALREQVANALFNKGVALRQLGRGKDEIAAYDNLIARFGDATETSLRERVAKALFNKGVALRQLGRGEDEIAAYDNLIARFGHATETSLREHVAKALRNKGIALRQLGRGEDEIAAYNNLLARFGDATEPTLREHVAKTNNSKGYALLCRAKGRWQDTLARTANLAAAMACFTAALGKTDTPKLRGMTLGNQAYAAALSGESEDRVRGILQQALPLGCETLYQATLKDFEISPVPEDSGFRQLLDAVWAEVKPNCEAVEQA